MTRIAKAPWAGVFRILPIAVVAIALAVSNWSTSLWQNGLVLIPLAALVALVARRSTVSPTTRHTLWLALLLWLVVGGALPPVLFEKVDSNSGSFADASKRVCDTRTGDSIELPRSRGSDERLVSGVSESDLPQIESVTSRPDPSIIVLGTVRPFTTTTLDYSTREDYERMTRSGGSAEGVDRPMPEPADCEPAEDHWRSPSICDAELVASADSCQSAEPVQPDFQVAAWSAPVGLTRIEARRFFQGHPGSQELAPLMRTSDVPEDLRRESWFVDMISGLARYGEFVFAPEIRNWIRPVAKAWESVTRLPAIPLPIWITGMSVVLMLRVRRGRAFRRIVERGVEAPADVRRGVEQAARAVGLTRVPRTIVVEDRVSPMVWFDGPATLILPIQLWRELDQAARRAVLCHELAHLRRHDHWICRFESWIGAVYWWHPLVWWIRGRLQEEAEYCCDAWVTWLQPGGRRAYAEALIQTKQFINPPVAPAPVGAIGMTSGRTRRFARRLTMVMTQRVSPNRSRIQFVAAAGILAIGWLVSPDRSHLSHGAERVAKPVHETRPSSLSEPSTPAPLTSAPPSLTTPAAKSAPSSAADDSYVELAAQIARLDMELKRLSELLDARGASSSSANAAEILPGLASTIHGRVRSPAIAGIAPVASSEPAIPAVVIKNPVYGRDYAIPAGRREALWNLMALSDVPPCVVESPNGITLNGTAAQHRAFAAFVELITASAEDRIESYQLPDSKLEAMKALMSRPDVPVLAEMNGNDLRIHGNGVTQRIIADFVELIHPTKAPLGAGDLSGESLFGTTAPIAGFGSINHQASWINASPAVDAYRLAESAAIVEREARSRRNEAKAMEHAYRLMAAAGADWPRADQLKNADTPDILERRAAEYTAMAGLLKARMETLRASLAQRSESTYTGSTDVDLGSIENQLAEIERAAQVLRESAYRIRQDGMTVPAQSELAPEARDASE